MSRPDFNFPNNSPMIVGSFGDLHSLSLATPESLTLECDIAEIRLDLFHEDFIKSGRTLWQHLKGFPLLFTARCHAEGSPLKLDVNQRCELLTAAMLDSSLVDIEVMSITEMAPLINELRAQSIPWIASHHNFKKLPTREKFEEQALIAKQAGAACFKCAAQLEKIEDLTDLVSLQMSDLGIPLSTMGMGVLAPVSRLLCAQVGSVLNYGYIGKKETAPGQWSAKQLLAGIRSLKPL